MSIKEEVRLGSEKYNKFVAERCVCSRCGELINYKTSRVFENNLCELCGEIEFSNMLRKKIVKPPNNKRFTVVFIFDYTLDKVILIEKNRGYYIGCLNGVGGKIEDSDMTIEGAALRELAEETGIVSQQLTTFQWLTTLLFPSEVELHVFYGIVKSGVNFKQIEDETLVWYPVKFTRDVTNGVLAGEGNVSYFINAALHKILSE